MLALSACTNWDVGVNGTIAVSNDPRGVADVDHTGLVWWETQGTTGADGLIANDTADDATTTEDATAGSDDVLAVEVLNGDAVGADVDDASAPDVGQDGLIAPDGVLDSVNPCGGTDRPIGCACLNSQQCTSGLCVYGASGLICSPSCNNVLCPAGWTCTLPAMVCKLLPDATVADTGSTDASGADALPDGAAVDAVEPLDVTDFDIAPLDGAADDAPQPDVGLTDASEPDALVADGEVADANAVDAGADAATDQADVPVPDGQLVDASVADIAVTDASSDVDTDGLTGLDWQGYPDASFPDDADIYGGAINSCLSLYLYQQETCVKNNPTAACIDGVANQGSLYANYLFEPVRACQDALCVDLCAAATDETCMNQCIGKNCPNQFLSCVSNDQHGTADCKTTFSCSMGYPGKLLTIGAKCYANGTLDAQLQVGGLISCETKPNTDSCFQAIGDCYDQGAAATNTCMQTITCTQGCAGAQECVSQCLGKSTPAARKSVDALGDCMVLVCGPKCNGDQNCQNTCLSTDCSAQFGNCISN